MWVIPTFMMLSCFGYTDVQIGSKIDFLAYASVFCGFGMDSIEKKAISTNVLISYHMRSWMMLFSVLPPEVWSEA